MSITRPSYIVLVDTMYIMIICTCKKKNGRRGEEMVLSTFVSYIHECDLQCNVFRPCLIYGCACACIGVRACVSVYSYTLIVSVCIWNGNSVWMHVNKLTISCACYWLLDNAELLEISSSSALDSDEATIVSLYSRVVGTLYLFPYWLLLFSVCSIYNCLSC